MPMSKSRKGIVRIPNELIPDKKRDYAWSYGRIHSDPRKAREMHGKDSLTDLWELYSAGYKMAGDLLIDNADRYTDYLVYPIVFAYRHSIELRLKQICIEGNKLFKPPVFAEDRIKDMLYREHNLDSLWNCSKTIIEKLFPDDSKENLASIKKMIDLFSSMDNTSYKFRYPVDTKGISNHPDQDMGISFIALKKIMNDLTLCLSGTAECIYDMPGHGYFLPGQSRMNEEQIKELLGVITKSEKNWYLEEIPALIKERYGLCYSPEQVLSNPELGKLFIPPLETVDQHH